MRRCCHCGHYGHPKTHCQPRRKTNLSKDFRIAHEDQPGRRIRRDRCYRYTRFGNQESIRLLVLLPGEFDDPIRCTLFEEPTNGIRRYEAISYVWGDLSRSGTVYCDGRRLQVPQNLVDALRRFRRAAKRRVLWADSICINQDNTAERESQVRKMGSVYEKAKRVLVWLGNEEGFDFYDLFRFIERVASKIHNDPKDYTIRRLVNSAEYSLWKSFRDFLCCPWFERVWVVQEIGFATDAILHHNAEILRWSDLVVMINSIIDYRMDIIYEHDLSLFARVSAINLSDFRGVDQNQNLMFVVLASGQNRYCSDARDHVYAFMAHPAFRTTLSNPHSEFFLPISYEISPEDLFTSVTTKVIQTSHAQPFHTLSFVSHTERTLRDCDRIRSWSPQWNIHKSIPAPMSGPGWSFFNAQAETGAGFCFREPFMTVRGLNFDSIVWISDTCHHKYFPTNPSQAFDIYNPHPLSQIWNRLGGSTGEISNDMLEAMVLTLIHMERLITQDPLKKLSEAELRQQLVSDFLDYSEQMRIVIPSPRKDSGYGYHLRFLTHACFFERRFFITSRGWMGLAPDVASVGHKICSFFGAESQFVLWELPPASESIYRLCGDCYVHGIMHGEAIKMWKDGLLEEKTFNLL